LLFLCVFGAMVSVVEVRANDSILESWRPALNMITESRIQR
jgi:hypothetical protein